MIGNFMEQAFQPELWADLYVMLGTSAAALIGLLFIATSLHLDDIVNNPAFHTRAYHQTIYLLLLLLEAVLILTPLPVRVLGAALTAVNLFGLSFPVRNTYRFFYKNKEVGGSAGWALSRAIRYFTSFLLGIAGGICLIEQLSWSMYIVTAAYFLLLASVILNAWAIMLGIGRTKSVTRAS
jgi:hypothetical protein